MASPQIRNAGTIGGNLSQDTRCHYYRDGYPCYRAEGNTCYANTPTAMNREHTLFEASRCVAVTPSDTAPVTVVLETEMVIQNEDGERSVAGRGFLHRSRYRHHPHDRAGAGGHSGRLAHPRHLGGCQPIFREGRGQECLGLSTGQCRPWPPSSMAV